jgi:hypothetical protein
MLNHKFVLFIFQQLVQRYSYNCNISKNVTLCSTRGGRIMPGAMPPRVTIMPNYAELCYYADHAAPMQLCRFIMLASRGEPKAPPTAPPLQLHAQPIGCWRRRQAITVAANQGVGFTPILLCQPTNERFVKISETLQHDPTISATIEVHIFEHIRTWWNVYSKLGIEPISSWAASRRLHRTVLRTVCHNVLMHVFPCSHGRGRFDRASSSCSCSCSCSCSSSSSCRRRLRRRRRRFVTISLLTISDAQTIS